MPSPSRRRDHLALSLAILGALAAAGCKAETRAASDASAAPEAGQPDALAPTGRAVDATKTGEPQATQPARAPAGARWLPGGEVLVQRCDDEHPCAALLQPEGVERCATLELGERDAWRLPTREEVAAMGKLDGLESRAGYHWTSSPDEVNGSMFWIVDPEGTQPTTIPADRKPFLIRCAHDG